MILDDVLHDGPKRAIKESLLGTCSVPESFLERYSVHPKSPKTMTAFMKTNARLW